MSIKSVNVSWGQSIKNYFWNTRQKADGTSNLESAELTRLFNRLLSAGVLGSGVGLASLAVFNVVSWPVGLLVIPCAFASMGLNAYNNQLKDFENPYELERLQNKTSKMSLEEVVQTYGWSDMLRLGVLTPDGFSTKYRAHLKGKSLNEAIHYYEKAMRHVAECASPKFNYQVPRLHELSMLWRQETGSMNCEQIFQTYPLEKLEKYSLVELSELNCIKSLKRDYDAIKMQHDQKMSQIEQEFQSSTALHKSTLDRESALAGQLYHNHAIVKELQGFEMHYTKERLKVQEQQNKSIAEARSRFDSALPFSMRGKSQDYSRLKPAEKEIYDRCLREFQQAESSARHTGCQKIDQINKLRSDRLQHLHSEEVRLKQERTQSLAAAKSRYEESIREFVQKKEAALRPIQSALAITAGDCDARYRAYLRMSGARGRN